MNALRALVCAALLGLWLPAGAASAAEPETRCVFGGPSPGFRVITLDLPEGSDVVVLTINGQRPPRPVNDDTSWHLAQGVMLVDATTLEIVSHQVDYMGTAAPGTVVEVEGDTLARYPHPGPEGPFVHGSRRARSSLPPGTYHAIAFGTGGGPTQWWGGSVTVAGTHPCSAIGTGETFDHDHRQFEGGTQVYTPGFGYAEGATLTFSSPRSIVAGLIDVAVQGSSVGSATMNYETPTANGELSREIVPFVSTSGDYAFEANYSGAFPIVAVAGVGVDLP